MPLEIFQILKDDAPNTSANVENTSGPQDWKRSIFIPIPKKGSTRECSNYWAIVLTFHANKVMLKILQARLQQYLN